MSSEPLNPSSASPRNSTSPTNRRVSFADDAIAGSMNRHGSFDTDPASASPRHKRISFADSLDDDYSRPGSMFSHGRRGQPGSRSQMSRTCSLDVDFVDDNATAWPRSFQRASSYFAGTALLLTPAQVSLFSAIENIHYCPTWKHKYEHASNSPRDRKLHG